MRKEDFNKGWTVRKSSMGSEVYREATSVILPHDAMIMEKRDPKNPGGTAYGFYPGGDYEYVKKYTVPEAERDLIHMIEFEGIMGEGQIYVNGCLAGSSVYGYTGKRIDLTPFLNPEEENTILVKVFNSAIPASRWYTGSGLYRPVWMYVGRKTRIALRGVRIMTPEVSEELSEIRVETRLETESRRTQHVVVKTEILDANGICVASHCAPHTFTEGSDNTVFQRVFIRDAKLWSLSGPVLYTARVSLIQKSSGGSEILLDEVTENFGIRKVTADPVRGLCLNGEPVKLLGGCIHHDNGPLGAATFERAEERRAELLKAAGFNAVRTSHNSASKAFLSACDRIGLLVMEESYDMWTGKKSDYDYARYFAEYWQDDLEDIVGKDFNHPSVIMYSIGNEIQELASNEGKKWSRVLANAFRRLDPTRLVTNAVNGTMGINDILPPIIVSLGLKTKEELMQMMNPQNPAGINDLITLLSQHMDKISAHPLIEERLTEAYEALDLVGLNYMAGAYRAMAERFPQRVFFGSETTPPSITKNMRLVRELPACAGDFTWTAWDYIGEAGVGVVEYNKKTEFAKPYPCYLAYCGDLDITGFRRPLSYYREIVFGKRKAPYIAVQLPEHYEDNPACTPWALPYTIGSWTFPESVGKPCKVEVYCASPEVELFINGKSCGRKTVSGEDNCRVIYDVMYEPGTVEAVAYEADGTEESFSLMTAENSLQLSAIPDRKEVHAGDLVYIPIELQDDHGILRTDLRTLIRVSVEGAGVMKGFASGDPLSEENFFDCERKAWYGRALLVVQAAEAGDMLVKIQAAEEETTIHLIVAE